MFNWKFWQTKPRKPGLFFEVNEKGQIEASAYWPVPKTPGEAQTLGGQMAALMTILHLGQGWPFMEDAVSQFAVKSKMVPVAHDILRGARGVIAKRDHENTDDVFIHPLNVFSPYPEQP